MNLRGFIYPHNMYIPPIGLHASSFCTSIYSSILQSPSIHPNHSFIYPSCNQPWIHPTANPSFHPLIHHHISIHCNDCPYIYMYIHVCTYICRNIHGLLAVLMTKLSGFGTGNLELVYGMC